MALVKQVTIVGLGLMGGSLGMALRQRRLAKRVVGISRNAATIALAKRRGAIDVGAATPEGAAAEADLVVLATPVDAIVPEALRLAPHMRHGAVLTDMGSTKGRIVAALERGLPSWLSFVGSHPLVGSEHRGIASARRDLLDGATCVVTRTPRSNEQALRLVSRLWKAVAARVVVMDPATHDRLLAAVSHLPHLLAFCLTGSTPTEALAVAPRSFLDVTRVAASHPDLWDDILLSNDRSVLAAMDRFERDWKRLRQWIEQRQGRSLQRYFQHAQAIRQHLDA